MLNLPVSDPEQFATAINSMVAEARAERTPFAVEWSIIRNYLRGFRKMRPAWGTGSVEIIRETAYNDLLVRYDGINKQFQREVGVLSGVDVRPYVKRGGAGLGRIRKNALAQVILSEQYRRGFQSTEHQAVLTGLLTYHTMGMVAEVVKQPGVGPVVINRSVPPWELYPVPATAKRPSDVTAWVRCRKVRLGWLRSKNVDLPKDDEDVRLESIVRAHGQAPSASQELDEVEGIAGAVSTGTPAKERWVELKEVFEFDEMYCLERYSIVVGRYVSRKNIVDYTKEAVKPPCPLIVGQADELAIWGRSWIATLLPANVLAERSVSRLFRNVDDLDVWGKMLVPRTWRIAEGAWNASRHSPFISYEPDYAATRDQLHPIQPHNSGELPGRAANFAIGMMRDLSSDSEMYSGQAPGRFESGTGVASLREMSMVSRASLIRAMATMYTRFYRACLYQAKILYPTGTELDLDPADEDLLGVVVNPGTGQVRTSTEVREDDPRVQLGLSAPGPVSMVPEFYEVDLSIADMEARSAAETKQEMLALFDRQLLTPDDMAWQSMTQDLSLPVGWDAKRRAEERRSALLDCYTLWGDGESPGQVPDRPFALPDVYASAIELMMAKAEFKAATPAVQQAFQVLYTQYQQRMGGQLPPGMPTPEQAAQEAESGGMGDMSGMGMDMMSHGEGEMT